MPERLTAKEQKKINKFLKINYQKNISIIKKRWPHLASFIESIKTSKDYEIVKTDVKGLLNLKVKAQGKDIFLHSNNPIEEARTILVKEEYRHPQFLIFLGMGLGYYPLAFLQTKKRTIRFIIIVEKDPVIFKWALKLTDLRELLSFPELYLIVGESKEKLYVRLRKLLGDHPAMKYYAKTIKIVEHPPSIALYRNYYFSFLKDLRDAVRETLLFFGNDPEDSLIGLDNIIKNLKNIILNPGIKSLFGKFYKKPAICVASGPSLKKNVHLLKDIKDKALIICCDATLKPLLNYGIKPHMVTTLERVPQTVKFFEQIDEDLSETWLVSCPVVVPEVYETYKGPHIIAYRAFAHFKWLGIDKGMLTIGPSCANMSFKIAEAMGCDPIILVGQDLAFAEDGKSHVEGHVFGEQNVKPTPKGTLYVEGVNGKPVLTTQVWYMFLKHFELDISEYKGTCIDATEGGAKIKGTKIMTLKEAIDLYVTSNIWPEEIIKEHLEKMHPEKIEKDFIFLSKRIKETEKFIDDTLRKFEALLKEIIEYKNTYLGKILNRERDELTFNEIKKTEELLIKIQKAKTEALTHRLFYLYLMHVVQPYVIKSEVEFAAIIDKYKNPAFANIELVAKHEEWFTVMIKLIRICRSRLQWAQEMLKNLEIKPSH